MSLGILLVSCGMLLQTLTYCLVKETGRRGQLSVAAILINAHLLMGLICLPLLFIFKLTSHFTVEVVGFGALVNLSYLVGQFFMFSAINRSDASAASPYLILKLPLVALLSVIVMHESLSLQQLIALAGIVLLSLFYSNAVKISMQVLCLVLLSALCFTLCDIFVIKAARAIAIDNSMMQGFFTVIICDVLFLALLPCVWLTRSKLSLHTIKAVTPLSLCWLGGVATIIAGFNLAGIISGNIILSLRALCAVILVALFFRGQLSAPGRFTLKSVAAAGLCACVALYYV